MNLVWAFLLALVLCVSSAASAAPAAHCCPLEDCAIAQCADMGCASAAGAMAVPALAAWSGEAAPFQKTAPSVSFLQRWYPEVWTPPD